MTRHALYAVAVALFIWLLIALSGATRSSSGDPIPDEPIPAPPPATSIPPAQPVNTLEVAALRRRVRLEHARYLQAHRRVRTLTRVLLHRTSTREAIELGCTVYGVSCSTLWRRANCESHLNPGARNTNSGASGLLQFLPSTWNTTPYAGFDIYSAYANALAAGWMLAHGRGGEWSCR